MSAAALLGRAALPALLAVVIAPAASASQWGGRPADGVWRGQSEGQPASFRVAAHGSEIRDIVLHVPYRCTSASSGQRIPGGVFVFRSAEPVPINTFTGWTPSVKVRLKIPGVRRSYPGAVSGLFTAHHPIPPAADRAEFSLSGEFARNDGDECALGKSGEVRWHLHPGR